MSKNENHVPETAHITIEIDCHHSSMGRTIVYKPVEDDAFREGNESGSFGLGISDFGFTDIRAGQRYVLSCRKIESPNERPEYSPWPFNPFSDREKALRDKEKELENTNG